jgi:hypothetical protein
MWNASSVRPPKRSHRGQKDDAVASGAKGPRAPGFTVARGKPASRGGCFTKQSRLRCINQSWDTAMPGPPTTSIWRDSDPISAGFWLSSPTACGAVDFRRFMKQPPRKRGPPGWGAGCPRHGKSSSRRCRLPGRGVTQAGASQWIAVSLPKVERSLQHSDGADGGSGAAQNWRFMSQHRQREPASEELDVLAPHSSLRRAG